MTEEMVSRLQAGVVKLEAMFDAIQHRLGCIEVKMVSSDVLDQIVTRLLDRIAADTVKPGCKAMFEDYERRLRYTEQNVTTLVTKMAFLAGGIGFLAALAKDFILR